MHECQRVHPVVKHGYYGNVASDNVLNFIYSGIDALVEENRYQPTQNQLT